MSHFRRFNNKFPLGNFTPDTMDVSIDRVVGHLTKYGYILEEDKSKADPGCQELASFRQAQKMPSILSSNAYLLIRDKKRCFFSRNTKIATKMVVFYLVYLIFT